MMQLFLISIFALYNSFCLADPQECDSNLSEKNRQRIQERTERYHKNRYRCLSSHETAPEKDKKK